MSNMVFAQTPHVRHNYILITIHDADLANNLNNQKQTDTILLDFKKHLIKYMYVYHTRGIAPLWDQSYSFNMD